MFIKKNVKRSLFLILCFHLFISCFKNDSTQLSELSEVEVLEKFRNHSMPDFSKVLFKNEKNEILSYDSIKKTKTRKDLAADYYVNKEGVIKEIIVRKSNEKDLEFRKKLRKALKEGPMIKSVEVNCLKFQQILDSILIKDQKVRKGNYDLKTKFKVDHENLEKVVSIIEKCGMPTLKNVSKEQMTAIWLVFQHSPSSIRLKYFPILEKSSINGDLDSKMVAMMKDRTLMDEEKQQLYGTQVIKNKNTGKMELYNLSDPQSVDKRRKNKGFETSLKDYLERFNIDFNVKQLK
jgi:hypothetical protein